MHIYYSDIRKTVNNRERLDKILKRKSFMLKSSIRLQRNVVHGVCDLLHSWSGLFSTRIRPNDAYDAYNITAANNEKRCGGLLL